MKKLTNKNNFAYLFVSLIVFLFNAAVVVEFPSSWNRDIFSFVTIVMLGVSIKSLKTDKTWVWTVYSLITFFIITTILEKIFSNQLHVYSILLILLIFFIGSFITAARQILFVGEIDMNKIIGSLSLYLLLGLIWTVIYLLLLAIDPTVFSGIEATHWEDDFSRMSYYSFVTLTTLGYGDILPVNRIAEFFVYMEAIIGVFYMAIIVASLISHRKPINKDFN